MYRRTMYRNGLIFYFWIQTFFTVHTFLIPPRSSLLKTYKSKATTVIPGEPLFLTPYIEAGLIEAGQNASRVPSLLGNGLDLESYSGFLTVNKRWNSNLFFWFFPNERKIRNAPVLLWLQGGPGGSSLFGLFAENGPYGVRNGSLMKREYTWTKDFNVLYIDQPVGTGFSFTQANDGYARDQRDVVRDLHPALKQFFRLFPEYTENDFYLTGESYAGKYVPAIATEIHRKNKMNADGPKINLKGLLIGNGWIDPENMLVYGDYLYQLGFLDSNMLKKIHEYEHLSRTYIRSKQYALAHLYWGAALYSSPTFPVTTGIYDYTRLKPVPLEELADTVNSDVVRKSIHVGNFEYNVLNRQVYYRMLTDMMQTVAPLFAELLRHYRILIYNGQFDVICAYPLTRSFLQNLHFDSAVEYQQAAPKPWRDDVGVMAGHWKTVGNLTEILVRNAGHMVPTDQPEWAYHMVRNFINGAFT